MHQGEKETQRSAFLVEYPQTLPVWTWYITFYILSFVIEASGPILLLRIFCLLPSILILSIVKPWNICPWVYFPFSSSFFQGSCPFFLFSSWFMLISLSISVFLLPLLSFIFFFFTHSSFVIVRGKRSIFLLYPLSFSPPRLYNPDETADLPYSDVFSWVSISSAS